MRWDREKFQKPNLHVYDKDDTKIMVYNMRMWSKRRGIRKPRAKERLKNTSLKEELWTRD